MYHERMGEGLNNDALVRRIADVLRQLRMLAEGAATNLDPNRVHSSKVGTREPRDFGESLYHAYLEKFQAAKGNSIRLALICRVAEREVELMRPGGAQPATDEHLEANRKEQAKWIIEDAEGLTPRQIADEIGCPAGWVERVRREARTHPMTGMKMEDQFIGWDDDMRFAEVQKLRARGTSQVKAALALGVSRQLVQRYWYEHAEIRRSPGRPRKAAA